MKIITAEQIREADAYTIAREPVKSIDLMERAANACFSWIRQRYDRRKRFYVFSGNGNNGGDGLAIARLLYRDGYEVIPYIIHGGGAASSDCRINEARLMQLDLGLVRNVYQPGDVTEFESGSVLIDALFGTGLNRPPEGLAASVIGIINGSGLPVIAIDIPSGLFADSSSAGHRETIVKATHTLTFQLMKRAFFFPENDAYTGRVTVLGIGLDQQFIAGCNTSFFMLEKEDVKIIAAPRNSFSHKGTFGHALLVCGSMGKAGAAILAARACLRSGAGLLTVHIPKSVFKLMPVAVPESMFSGDSDWDCFTDAMATEKYDAIGVGCGIGTSEATGKALKNMIREYRKPMVIDADAINLLASNPAWLEGIPPGSIFTPHPREFERLVGKAPDHFDRNRIQLEFAEKHNVYLLLKGHYTSIACPDGTCYFNPTGNPGMATAGSGDVLTGIITGLLAQGLTPKQAALGGVYLHGLAGDMALSVQTEQSLLASDIIANLGNAFRILSEKEMI